MRRFRSLRTVVLVCAVLSAAALPGAFGTATASPARGTFVAKAQWQPDAKVDAIRLSRTRVFIGGDFTHLTNVATGQVVARRHLAAFNRSTGALIHGWVPIVDGEVTSLALLGPRLVLGGNFTTVNGQPRQNLAAVNVRTGHLSPWQASVDGPVNAVLSLRGSVYVGGHFDTADGQPRDDLFAVDGHGVLAPNWPNQSLGETDHKVWSLGRSADRRSVIVGGSFSMLAGSPRSNLGEIARVTGNVRAWAPAPRCPQGCNVYVIRARDNAVYAGLGGPGGALFAYRADTGATIWRKHTNGNVTALAFAGTNLIVGGHFTSVHGHPHIMLAQLLASSGRVTTRSFETKGSPYPGILALDVHNHRIRIGGAFKEIARQTRYAIVPE